MEDLQSTLSEKYKFTPLLRQYVSGRAPRPEDWAWCVQLFRERMTGAAPRQVCEISTFLV
jgi:hypothetical protein